MDKSHCFSEEYIPSVAVTFADIVVLTCKFVDEFQGGMFTTIWEVHKSITRCMDPWCVEAFDVVTSTFIAQAYIVI